jgi:hypothetical protein
MNLSFNTFPIISVIITFGIFIGIFLVLKRIFTFMRILYFFLKACSLYRKMQKNLTFLATGQLSHDQKQAYCFQYFNVLFKQLYWMGQSQIFLSYATVDIQKCFWTYFVKQNPLFYMRGFSCWDLKTYDHTLKFVRK